MSLHSVVGLFVALVILLGLALQYPFSTTFPIGGDAASHIRAAQTVLVARSAPSKALVTLRNSNYPLSHFLLASTSILPISWSDRFIWWATTGHILTGLAIGALLWRIASWRAAAAGMAIWALTSVGINTHFEDGTAPQLWSLIFMILAFERLAANSTWGTLIMVAATIGTHFLSGFILIASLLMGIALLLPVRHHLAPKQARLIKYLGVLIAFLAALATFKIFSGISWPSVTEQSEDVFLLDTLKSKFTPWVIISIPGIAILISKLRRRLLASTSLLCFFWFSLLLTTNSTLNVGLWESRFRTYFIVSICLAAGLALPGLTRHALRPIGVRLLFLGLLFATLTTLTWRDNATVYRFYENPANNARLSSEVQNAIDWMNSNLPSDSYIASSAASRHAEWIPALTPFKWQDLDSGHTLFSGSEKELLADANTSTKSFTHVVFLTHQEDVNAAMLTRPDLFPIVFTNPSTVIFQLP